jgi:alpha-beta hydrolase superfamily lysophospholipase
VTTLRLIFFCITINLLGCSSFLYWPTHEVHVDMTKLPIPPQIENLPIDQNEKINIWTFKTPAKKPKGVFVQFHGNGQNLSTHFLYFYWVVEKGYDLVVFDYRGYGQSSDYSTNPKSTVEDGVAVLRYVQQKFPKQKRIAVGQSLGGAVLLSSLLQAPPEDQPEFVVLDSTFASYQQAARSVLKKRWFLYPIIPFTYLTFSDKYAPIDHLRELNKQPKVVVHGNKDNMIDHELGQKLYEGLPEPKQFWTVDEGFHTAAFSPYFFSEYSKKLLNFIGDPQN